MKRAALSANALQLPARPSVSLELVRGRHTMVRYGIFFTVIGKHRRSVYMQLDGKIILADECKCLVRWLEDGGIEVLRNRDCPIDDHQRLTLQDMQWHEEDD